MIDVAGLKLGKSAPQFDVRTLRLAHYIEKRKLPVVPSAHTLSRRTLATFPKLGMMLNDELGCCTVSSIGHMEQTWSVYGGKPWRPSDTDIRVAYDRVNGGVDEGAAMLDVLKMLKRDGIGGNKIYAYVSINPLDHDQVRTAHLLFGGLYVGANLPISAQDQLEVGPWDVVAGNGSEPGSWGGHAFNVVDYSKAGLTCVTWGQLQKLTWAWLDRYCDEAYAILEEDYVGDDKRSPQGISLAKLAADIKALG